MPTLDRLAQRTALEHWDRRGTSAWPRRRSVAPHRPWYAPGPTRTIVTTFAATLLVLLRWARPLAIVVLAAGLVGLGLWHRRRDAAAAEPFLAWDDSSDAA